MRLVSVLLFMTVSFGCTGATKDEKKKLSSDDACNYSRFQKSQEVFKAILKDLPDHYDQLGGEISEIRSPATNTYIVSISQEERIDQMTYVFEVGKDCKITILSRALAAISPWEEK